MRDGSPEALIEKFYGDSPAKKLLVTHSEAVTEKALAIAVNLDGPVDKAFIAQAAMLHDIGIIGTDAPFLGCRGDEPYMAHGAIGRRMLEAEGLPLHARVCERHIGVGILAAEIEAQGLPMPPRDILPETLEERIICFADKFFSKGGGDPRREKSVDEVRAQVARWGTRSLQVFDDWCKEFLPV